MGAEGRMTATIEQQNHARDISKLNNTNSKTRRSLGQKPPFTLGQLRNAIPPHCFNRSLIRSFSWVIHDLFFISLFLYFALQIIPKLETPLQFVAWPLYWVLQGSVLTGLSVIAHECGHHAFSKYALVDDTVGFFIHSSLLVPYFSWGISHRRHHANAGSLEHDEVNVPKQKSDISLHNDDHEYHYSAPERALKLLIAITFGFPMYLLFNHTGRKYPRLASHFDPYSPMYNDRERKLIFLSDIGILTVLFILYRLATNYGLLWLMRVYVVPVMVVNGFLVTVTYLHHTHWSLPRFDTSEWEFIRGALSTMDRDFAILNRVFHNMTDTHVLHHIFPKIPHYHAMEAFSAIKPILGDYCQIDRTPMIKALWREAKDCIYVAPDEEGEENKGGVYWFQNKF